MPATFIVVGANYSSINIDKAKEKIEPTGSVKPADVEIGNVDALAGTVQTDRALSLKRDVVLVPVLGLLYMIMFLDRTNIANAKIEGMPEDLNMPEDGYGIALSLFYIPFVLAEVPSNLLLNSGKIPPNYYLGAMTALLGCLAACQGVVASYHGLYALRFLMGVFEAALPGACTYLISMYYTKREAAVRFAWFFNFALAGPMFSGLLAYAIVVDLEGTGGYEGWRWIFIIEGLMTVAFGLIALAFLPNFPERAQTWFLKLSQKESLIAALEASRGREEKGAVADQVSIWKVLIDWRIHLFTMCFFCCDITAASISAFMTTILTDLGYESTQAQLMTMPVWAAGIVSTFCVTWLSSKLNWRFPFVYACQACQLVGWIIMRVYVPAAGVRYAALFFMSIGTFPLMALFMAWLSANLRGRKYLAVGMAWQVGFGNCANFVSSNVFFVEEAPYYPTGFSNGLAWTVVGMALVTLAVVLMSWKNKARAARMASMTEQEREEESQLSFKFLI